MTIPRHAPAGRRVPPMLSLTAVTAIDLSSGVKTQSGQRNPMAQEAEYCTIIHWSPPVGAKYQ
jgi:hypothetical protein